MLNTSLFFQPKPASTANRFFDKQANDLNNSQYEQEANLVAEKVMKISSFQPTFFAPTIIQRTKNISDELPGQTVSLSGEGEKLNNSERHFFESRMGYDFSNVRIHNNSRANESAEEINALAYTTQNNIVFNADRYQPGTIEGKKLLAHELTHIIQQQNAPAIQKQAKPGGADNNLKAGSGANYYIALLLKGAFNASHEAIGITQQSEQKFSAGDMVHDESMCLNDKTLTADINFCRGTPNTAVNPPITALAIEYKEPGRFTSLKTSKRDENPIPDVTKERTCWQPNFPTHFTFDVYKKGTLSITAELFGTDNNELNIYSDVIDIEKCPGLEKCTENAIATNRWLIMPDNGGPLHPLGPSDPDDGEHYEIYKETGTENYFICTGESVNDRTYVDRSGYAL